MESNSAAIIPITAEMEARIGAGIETALGDEVSTPFVIAIALSEKCMFGALLMNNASIAMAFALSKKKGHDAHRCHDPGGWRRLIANESAFGGQSDMRCAAICLGKDANAQLAVNPVE